MASLAEGNVDKQIKALEAQLAQLRLMQSAEQAEEKKTASAANRENARAFEGQNQTQMLVKGKIGGDFAAEANPSWLDDRLALFEQLKEREAERIAAKRHIPITITLPDGKTISGVSWETTPMSAILDPELKLKGLSKKACVARVTYTGERVDPDNISKDHDDNDTLGDSADIGGDDGDGDDEAAARAAANSELWDMTRPLEGDCNLEILTFDDKEGEYTFWHSTAHMLGQALERQFGAKLTIGPALTNGFFYDCYVGSEVCTEKTWYPKIDKVAKQIVKEKQAFERLTVTKQQLLQLFAGNPFKIAIISDKIPDGTRATVYRNGPFVDLCTGPHIPNSSMVRSVKMFKHSATYWLNSEECDSLQRVYGISFPDNKRMKQWEKQMAMRKAGDHRVVGPRQGLFFMHELTPGSAFFLPQGARMYNKLVDFIKDEYWARGYDEVVSPNIYSTDLWKISGHYYKYREDMFLFYTKDKKEFAMKPMNCPGHCLMFRHMQGDMSYKALPIRMADFGVLHRNERSGALGGLTRVRRFQQDDAHIFCRPDQVADEVVGALNFMRDVYRIFGMKFRLWRSTRPASAIGVETEAGRKRWDDAEAALAIALDSFAGEGKWKDDVGGGAFYGPKIDIKVYDSMGRAWQCATVQLDFNLPIRFDLRYKTAGNAKAKTNEQRQAEAEERKAAAATAAASAASAAAGAGHDGCGHNHSHQAGKDAGVWGNLPNRVAEVPEGFERPVMVHRAMLGSVERMFAVLTEHYQGKWPLWLSPRQVMIIPVHEEFTPFAKNVRDRLRDCRFYADCDSSARTLKKMVREAQLAQYNYIIVVGRDEVENDTVSIRLRGDTREERGVKVADFLARLQEEVRTKAPPPTPAPAESKSQDGSKKTANKKAAAAAAGAQSDWSKCDIRVGVITRAWEHPESDKLWCEEIDVGEESGPRQIASGLRKHYPAQADMEGRKVLVVCNLKPAKLAGFKSCGMVLCASQEGEDGNATVEFVDPPAGAAVGERVFIDGDSGEPVGPSNMKKKKIFEKVAKQLKTNGDRTACWNGKPVMTSAGACTAPTLADAFIK